jgi:hypothetical protein
MSRTQILSILGLARVRRLAAAALFKKTTYHIIPRYSDADLYY